MAAIQDLIAEIKDESLRLQIEREVAKLQKQKKFGLVYEDHRPENVALYEVKVKKGQHVALRNGNVNETWYVNAVRDGMAVCIDEETAEEKEVSVDDLVVVCRFGEPIYPYLKPMDNVCNAPDSDLWHTLIQADNYLALQLLAYLYPGQVDCIYIDPPYNTGARDWKYNNDYVDAADQYRHSKWLSFMEKRLKLAKLLLNPKDSVLIVTIDEKEYHHLACLLEELFPEARIQMVTDVINPKGVSSKSQFSRTEEYIYFVFIGNSSICPGTSDMLHPQEEDKEVRWASLLRSGNNSARTARPNLFYPLYFDNINGNFIDAGSSLKISQNKDEITNPPNCFAVWPMKANGNEATWSLQQCTLLEKMRKGYVKFGPWKQGNTFRSVSYLAEGMEKAVENGEIEILGKDENGSIITGRSMKQVVPLTVWNQSAHSAGDYGSSLLLNLFKEKRFTFPKSIYAEYDTIKSVVANKPNALIIDFFAGSGTTLHAVNLLNKEDGGNRRCIMVTNNEVSDAEAKDLTKRGLKPGDEEWEKLGIAQYVTWPRTVCSIEGHDVNGQPLKGNYIGSDAPMADGFKANAAFYKLGFLDKTEVALGRQLESLIPILWLRAGAVGPCPKFDLQEEATILRGKNFAILTDEADFADFEEEMNDRPEMTHLFIITDSDNSFREMSASLRAPHCYQLYKDYLDNFRINKYR